MNLSDAVYATSTMDLRLRYFSQSARVPLHPIQYSLELDLQSLFGLLCTAVFIGRDPATPPAPRLWAHIRGRYWSTKIDDISL